MPGSGPAEIHLRPPGIAVAESIHDRDFRMESTTEPFHEILHVVRGGMSVHTDGSESNVVIPAGGYTTIPAGVSHQVVDTSGSTVLLLCASETIISRSPERQFVWNGIMTRSPLVAIPGTRDESERIHGHWRRLLGLQDQPECPETRLRLLTHFDECLLALYDLFRAESNGDTDSRIRRIIQDIEQTFSDRWSVERAARRTGLSVRWFSERFRQLTGQTFVPWLNERRIKHSCKLLATGQYTITGAAFASGFEDMSHFYRVFDRVCGRTPRQWVLENNVTSK